MCRSSRWRHQEDSFSNEATCYHSTMVDPIPLNLSGSNYWRNCNIPKSEATTSLCPNPWPDRTSCQIWSKSVKNSDRRAVDRQIDRQAHARTHPPTRQIIYNFDANKNNFREQPCSRIIIFLYIRNNFQRNVKARLDFFLLRFWRIHLAPSHTSK